MSRKIIAAFLLLYAGVRTLMDIVGGIDLVIERSEDPSWLAEVGNFLLNPPGWIILTAVCVGFALLILPSIFKRMKPAPGKGSDGGEFPAANLDEWRKVNPLELWRAGCLWKGFQPHDRIGFNDPAYASYIMLVNAAKAGQLTVTNPGAEVDAWSLVYRSELARFALSKGEMPEFLRDIGSEIAVDSGEKPIGLRPDTPVYKAVNDWLIDTSQWGIGRNHNQALGELRQAAHNGEVAVWGRRRRTAMDDLTYDGTDPPITHIAKEYWLTGDFDPMHCLIGDAPNGCHTQPDTGVDEFGFVVYQDIHVNWLQLEKKWPRREKNGAR